MQSQYPKITCLCPTRGRFETLKESVSFFLLQDYPNKEMVVFNNHPTDIIAHPKLAKHNVRIVNAGDYSSNTITEIYRDALASISEDTEYVAVWDDDDVYFPWHLSANMEQLLKSNKGAVRAQSGFWQHNPDVTLISNNLEASMIARKDLIFFDPLTDAKKSFHPHLSWVDSVQKNNDFAHYDAVSAMFRWSYGRQTAHLQTVGPHKNNDDGAGQILKPVAVDHIYYDAVAKASSDLNEGIETCIDKAKWFNKLCNYNIDKFNHLKYNVWLFWDKEHVGGLPAFYKKTIESIRSNTFCNVVVVNEESRKNYIPDVPDSYGELSAPIKSDFLRIALLKRYGGYWMDCDTIVHGDLDEYYFRYLSKYQTVLPWEHNIRPKVITPVLSSRPNSAAMTRSLNYILEHMKTHRIPGWGHLGINGIIRAAKELAADGSDFKLFGLKNIASLKYNNGSYKDWKFNNLRHDLNIIVIHGSTQHDLLALSDEDLAKQDIACFLDKCINDKYIIA